MYPAVFQAICQGAPVSYHCAQHRFDHPFPQVPEEDLRRQRPAVRRVGSAKDQDEPPPCEPQRGESCAARDEESVLVTRSLVSVVDDDESVRESLPDLLREFGYAAQAFASAEEFLASDCVCRTGCLILDVPYRASPASS